MAWKRIKQGAPFTFQELVFFSPRQFNEPVELQEKEFIFRLKVCVNSGRCFTGPFYDEVVGEEEISQKQFKDLMQLVHNTPGIIITGKEYVRYDDYGGLKRIYG